MTQTPSKKTTNTCKLFI